MADLLPRGVLSLLLLGTLLGCGQSGPKTYPVKGKVVTAKNEDLKRLVGKGVELQSTTEPNTRGFGLIQPDGSFTIATYRPGGSLKGAIEGTHKARLQLQMADDDEDTLRKKWPFDSKYTRFEDTPWTITVPSPEAVVLKVQ